jgi:hypothetical protein
MPKLPCLYDLYSKQKCSVYEVAAMGWNVEFKVRLQGILGEQWYELASKLNGVVLNGERDRLSGYGPIIGSSQ